MGQVGFGSYRISVRSKEHREALTHALALGCPLIDTSANYTDGDSEKLIGEVLKMNPEFSPIIVTKAGYIQGKNLEVANQFPEDLVDLGESLKHSIHPDFLKDQLDKSLVRLQKASIDTFLLHNPEYYFQTEGATQDEYYRRIEKAFTYLEEEVKNGRIKNYGISSNNFILPLADPAVTNLSRVLEAAKKVSDKHHFTTIQFPFNLIEIGALEKFGDYGDESLLELAKLNNLVTMSNRPLNAFTNEQLVRLATYDDLTKDFDEAAAEKHYEMCMKLVEEKWAEATKDDELVDMDDFHELTLIKQFKELWKTLPSPDAVEQVYLGHFFPFIARIWGESGLNAKEAKPFYELLDYSLMFARKNMTNKALAFKKQAEDVGLIPIETDQPFAVDVIETYLNYGIDYVLLGMRKTNYVDQVKHLFKA
jgi:aryl-alcohol dehydrogenase-like predicted oxidoreductase